MKRLILIVLIIIIADIAVAEDVDVHVITIVGMSKVQKPQFILPALYTTHSIVLEIFPLDKAAIKDVTMAYGDPQMRIDGAGKNMEIWTYYEGSTVYTFFFMDGKVHDINKRVTGLIWSGETLNARELQGINK